MKKLNLLILLVFFLQPVTALTQTSATGTNTEMGAASREVLSEQQKAREQQTQQVQDENQPILTQGDPSLNRRPASDQDESSPYRRPGAAKIYSY